MVTFDLEKLAGPLLMTAIIGFILYRRIRATVGRQRLRRKLLIIRLTILVVACGALLSSGAVTLTGWVYAVIGAGLGGALAFFALGHTKLERTPDGTFYTPHLMIGLAVIGLLLARVGSRLLLAGPFPQAPPHGQNPLAITAGNPLTLGILLLTLSYYLAFGVGLLLKDRRLELPRSAEQANNQA